MSGDKNSCKDEGLRKIAYLYHTPKYITPEKDPGSIGVSDDFLKDAIVSKDILTIWQNHVCGTLNYATTIIEFKPNTPDGGKFKSKDMVKLCRNDSQLAHISHKRVCQNIHTCLGNMRCYMCDDLLARLFENADTKEDPHTKIVKVDKKSIEENIYASFKKSKAGKSFYANYPHIIPVPEDDFLHGHVRTVCPMSGYIELAFPIVVYNRIIGVLFVGQISLKSRQDDEKNIRRAFLISPDIHKELQGYLNEIKSEGCSSKLNTVDKIINYLVDSPEDKVDNYFPITMDNDEKNAIIKPGERPVFNDSYGNPNEYEAFINGNGEQKGIIHSIKDLETLLENELKRVREKYVRYNIEQARVGFYKERQDMEHEDILSGKSLQDFWKLPREVMGKLVDSLDILCIAILGMPEITPVDLSNKPLEETLSTKSRLETLLLCSNFNSANTPARKNDICFNLPETIVNEIPESPTIYYNDSEMHKGVAYADELITNAMKRLNNICHLLYFPMIGKKELPIISIVFYRADMPHEIAKMVTNNLQYLLTSIFYVFSSIVGYTAESRSENTMILYRHETSQVAAGIDSINSLYLDPDSKLRINIYRNKRGRRDIYQNINRFTLLLSSMSQRIKIIQGRHELKKENFKPINIIEEIFENWTNAYSSTKEARYLKFDMPEEDPDNDLRPMIVSDKVLLNQIVFNLFGNAVKYAYRGTTIYLDYSRPFEESSEKKITIKDYGIGINTKDTEELYKLYYVEDHAKKLSDNSNGIGLYVVKRVVELLHGNKNHSSNPVSSFVIPYMEPFLKLIEEGKISRDERSPIDGKPASEYEAEIRRELEKIRENGTFEKVVSGEDVMVEGENKYSLTVEQIKDAIFAREKTYEVTFEVMLYGYKPK